jgi:hypothetical protein
MFIGIPGDRGATREEPTLGARALSADCLPERIPDDLGF